MTGHLGNLTTPATAARRLPRGETLRWIDSALNSAEWVDARPFRAHLHYLVGASGLHWRIVGHYCGLPVRTAERLLAVGDQPSTRRISHYCAARLLAVRPGDLGSLRRETVDADATRARVRELAERGHDLAAAGRLVGIAGTDLAMVNSDRAGTAPTRCSRLVALQVEALWQQLIGDPDQAATDGPAWPAPATACA